jgi:hypothetical protein
MKSALHSAHETGGREVCPHHEFQAGGGRQNAARSFPRIGEVTRMFRDEGLQPVHENCMNYGGMSWRHGLELLEKCPGLKWVFDTGNPVFNPDRSKPKPWPRQDAWEFWEHIRDHVVHIHVKDATYVPAKNDCDYNIPARARGACATF